MFGFNEAMLSLTQNMYLEFLENTSVVYPIFRRTGDRSDGDFNPGVNTTLTKNLYQWDEVDIPAGVTVTAKAPGLLILAKKVTISGLLTASGLGAAGGTRGTSPTGGADGGGLVGGGGGGGGAYLNEIGGNGGKGRSVGGVSVVSAAATSGSNDIDAFYNLAMSLSLAVGGGGGGGKGINGGNGGKGGGYIYIVCNEFILYNGGAIRAEGLNGTAAGMNAGGGGGGGGGAIIVDGLKITNAGIISVSGGAGSAGGSSGYAGGPGGDGYLRIIERRAV